MKLPIPSFFAKKSQPNFFLVLLLRDEKASAVIVEEFEGKIKAISRHEEYFTTNLEEASSDEWLQILDKTISTAEETLPSNIETQKTVFGVKDTWVEDKRIKKDYLSKLKIVCEKLSLSPIGFLVIHEAITHLIEEEEGAPLTAILAEIGKKTISLSLYKAGRIIESHAGPVEENIAKDTDTLLKQFSLTEVLPSRIILFNGDHDERLAQQFIAHQWSKSLPFLHVPQISLLPGGFDAKAVVVGAALQMGFEMLGRELAADKTDIQTLNTVASKTLKHQETKEPSHDQEAIDEGADLSRDKKADAPIIVSTSETFGFVQNEDIAELTQKEKDLEEPTHDEKSAKEEEQPKFHIGGMKHETEPNFKEVNQEIQAETQDDPFQNTRSFEKQSYLRNILSLLPLSSISQILRAVKLPRFPRGNKVIFAAPLIVLLFIAIALLYIFKLQATIVVHVDPKVLEEDDTVTFSATSANDFSTGVIQAKQIATTLDGKTTIDTTGKKETGTKTKGTVTIFNSSESKKVLSEGTAITSSNNLDFVLDKEVSIASASGDIFSGIKSGTAQVAVTAKNIGSDYNLPSNAKFTVGSQTSLAAKNDNAFSGGNKKELPAVAKKDLDSLNTALSKSLQEKARESLNAEIETGDTIIPIFTSTILSSKKYDREIGDEAKKITLSAKVTFASLTYNQQDLTEYASVLLKNKFSNDLEVARDGLHFILKDLKEDGDKEIKASLLTKASLLPKIDEGKILSDLAGKSFADAEDILAKIPQVTQAEITLSPNLPFLPKVLPRIKNNILIQVSSRE